MNQIRLSDGTRLAYEITGLDRGPVALLLDGISCDGFIWPYLRPELEAEFRVVHVHYRGHGLSGLPRDHSAVTIPHLAADLDEVMDRLELGPALCVAHSMGTQVCLELAWRYPERVRAGILLCGAAGRVLDTFKGSNLGARLLPTIQTVLERYPGFVGRTMRTVVPSELGHIIGIRGESNLDLIDPADFRPYMTHIATMPPDLFARMLRDAAERNAATFLHRLEQPMLVVAGGRDGFTPLEVSQTMVEGLANGTLEVLEQGSHTAPLELPGRIQSLVAAFVREHGLSKRPSRRRKKKAGPPPSYSERFRQAAAVRG